ncbi:MAG: DUF2752 domain-containing protein [Candidatus Pedobacter colombiensis]|uniref:DUF2752 domain-containing protein n=1 Tax=Candidatus Pedobacter colombiensis TaxID=3121371 RepID=A0AAJ5W8P7_9SPHI|nr:DUF2752 domain-containing protein [Pedobacter sp.]WEK19094.1 MAG: DUF2752 domain-containing protein [Pedobacter sp.]
MILKYISGLFIVIIISVLYYRYDPEMYSFFPECPFHKYVGLDCPGCGSQRAVHALLHGNILLALNYNVLLVLSLPFLVIHFLLKVLSYFMHKDLTWSIWYKPLTPKMIFVVVLLFWIGRNIPVVPFTYLAS